MEKLERTSKIAVALVIILAFSFIGNTIASHLITVKREGENLAPAPIDTEVASSGVPARIVVSCNPSKVFADNARYYYLVKVELQDLNSNPAYAPDGGITLSLSSSDRRIGTVDTSLTISAGNHYQHGHFYSTYTAGTTTITATAAGLLSGSSPISTWGRTPKKLKVFLAPDKLLTDNTYHYYPVRVQLQDEMGRPAPAPIGGIEVSLSSSNPTVGTVYYNHISISAGATYGVQRFRTTTVPGTTTITATASGLWSDSATMTTVSPGVLPATKLRLWLVPNKLPAIQGTNSYVGVVQQRDASDVPVKGAAGVTVGLSSSNPSIVSVPGSITIPAGASHTYFSVTTTYSPGTVTVTASSAGLTSSSKQMTTDGNKPQKLVVKNTPWRVFAHKRTSSSPVTVQIQDNYGNPARAPAGGYSINVASSDTSIGTVSSPKAIGVGQTWTYTSFTSTYKPGTTVISASATGLTSGQAKMVTRAPIPYKLMVDLAMPKVLSDGKTRYYIVRVLLLNAWGYPALAPAGGIIVSLASGNTLIGTVQTSVTIGEGTFFAMAWFKSTGTPGSTKITAMATIGGSSKSASNNIVTVAPSANPPAKVVLNPFLRYLSTSGYYSYTLCAYLVDAAGNPATAPSQGVYVTLESSDTRVATVPNGINIGSGSIYDETTIYTTWVPGTTTIKASATASKLTTKDAFVRTGCFTPTDVGYNFKNFIGLFYGRSVVVTGDVAHAREAIGASIIAYALGQAGATNPLIKTDGLITTAEYNQRNLILVGYNNTKTTAKNAAHGIVVNEDTNYFNITAEGKTISLKKADYPTKSIGFVYVTKDGTRAVMLAWGYGWQGTYAAALFINDPAKRLMYQWKHMLMLSWNDANTNGFVELAEISVSDSA